MSVEVERKFVTSERPAAERLGDGVVLRQGYLAEDGDVSVRVRISDVGAWLTVKAGAGMARTEVEVAVDPLGAEELWPLTAGRRVAKTRHRVALGDDAVGLVAEVDVFAGELTGLCLVEVEFATVEGATAFVPPAWFGREVTGDAGWSNAALARHGRPPSQPPHGPRSPSTGSSG